MKLTKRALSVLRRPNEPSALRAVVVFAAQNPGLEYANYGAPSPYRSDARRITAAWQRVKIAARMCGNLQVSDDDVMQASKRAFSGRLELERKDDTWRVHYCAGQYWPTEYRNACAAVLELAAEYAYIRAKAAA